MVLVYICPPFFLKKKRKKYKQCGANLFGVYLGGYLSILHYFCLLFILFACIFVVEFSI